MSMVKRPPSKTKQLSPQGYEGHWNTDGSAHAQAPKWAKYRTRMAGECPSPFRSTKDPLAQQVEKFVEKLDKLRPEKDDPGYLGNSGALRRYILSRN